MASHAIEGPYRRISMAWRVGGWIMFWICFLTLMLFATYARAESLTIFAGPQAPVKGWTSGHKYHTLGIGIYHSFYSSSKMELEAGLVYQQYMNGTTGRIFTMDLILTTQGRLYVGANAGFGIIHPRHFQDVGDVPCTLGGRFGPLVGYKVSAATAVEMRIDHLSAFTAHDKGRNHIVIGLKWRF